MPKSNRRLGVTEGLAIRVRTVEALGFAFPPTAQLLLDWARSARPKSQILSFLVPYLPPSINHIYLPGATLGSRRLSPEALHFREAVRLAIGDRVWKPSGVLMAIVFYQSPHWITKRREVRKKDIDNVEKALHDAIGCATGVNDCRFWEYHPYKIIGPTVMTVCYVVDMGDIVEVYK